MQEEQFVPLFGPPGGRTAILLVLVLMYLLSLSRWQEGKQAVGGVMGSRGTLETLPTQRWW